MDFKDRRRDRQMEGQVDQNRGVMWSPLSGSRRFLSGLCSSQLVKVAGGREGKKKRQIKKNKGI